MRPRNLIFSLLLLLLWSNPVAAQFKASAPNQAQVDAAQKYFDAGAALYLEREYEKAILEFTKGNAVVPDALFFYNLSLCHMKLKDFDEALLNGNHAESMSTLDAPTSARNSARIIALRTRQLSNSIQPTDPSEFVEEGWSGFGTMGYVGLSSTALGIGLLAAAAITNIQVNSLWIKYENAATEGDEDNYNSLKSDIESKQTMGVVMLGTGALLTVVGTVLVAVDLVNDSETAVFMSTDGESSIVGLQGVF